MTDPTHTAPYLCVAYVVRAEGLPAGYPPVDLALFLCPAHDPHSPTAPAARRLDTHDHG